jgi:hypothetical protein
MKVIGGQYFRTACRVEHLFCLSNIIRVFNTKMMKLAGLIARIGEMIISCKISVG